MGFNFVAVAIVIVVAALAAKCLIHSPHAINSISSVVVEIEPHASYPNRQFSRMVWEILPATIGGNEHNDTPLNHLLKVVIFFDIFINSHFHWIVRISLVFCIQSIKPPFYLHPTIDNLFFPTKKKSIIYPKKTRKKGNGNVYFVPFWKHFMQNVWRQVNTTNFWFCTNCSAQRKQRIQPNFFKNRSFCWRSIFWRESFFWSELSDCKRENYTKKCLIDSNVNCSEWQSTFCQIWMCSKTEQNATMLIKCYVPMCQHWLYRW